MTITVAGEKKEYKDGLTLPELIELENVDMPEYVTVSINEEFVATEDKPKTVLKDGDNVEFLGTIGIVDADEVDLSNLQRQIIHGTADVGKAKVKSAKETMNAMNPDVQVNTYRMFVDASNIRELIRDYDFIIDGTDNFPAKFLINDACVLEKKPFSHAGIIRFKGQLMTYVPGEGPCYRCVFKNPPPKDAVPTCKQAGVIGAMGGVIGSLQAMEAIKYLIGVGELLTGYLLTYDALTMEFHKIKLPKDTHNCAVCGDHPTILEPIDYEQEVCEETAGRFDAPRTQE